VSSLIKTIQNDEVLTWFDVVSLFTKGPTHLTLNITKRRLQLEPDLSKRTNLSPPITIKGLRSVYIQQISLFKENTTNKLLEPLWDLSLHQYCKFTFVRRQKTLLWKLW